MRSASTARRGFSVEARSISFTICAKRVSGPMRSMRTRTGPPRLKLPATTPCPAWSDTG